MHHQMIPVGRLIVEGLCNQGSGTPASSSPGNALGIQHLQCQRNLEKEQDTLGPHPGLAISHLNYMYMVHRGEQVGDVTHW